MEFSRDNPLSPPQRRIKLVTPAILTLKTHWGFCSGNNWQPRRQPNPFTSRVEARESPHFSINLANVIFPTRRRLAVAKSRTLLGQPPWDDSRTSASDTLSLMLSITVTHRQGTAAPGIASALTGSEFALCRCFNLIFRLDGDLLYSWVARVFNRSSRQPTAQMNSLMDHTLLFLSKRKVESTS